MSRLSFPARDFGTRAGRGPAERRREGVFLSRLTGSVETRKDARRLSRIEALGVGTTGELELPPRLVRLTDPKEHETEVEANDRSARVLARERPETRERARGVVLVEEGDCRRRPRVQALGDEGLRAGERPASGDGTAEPLEDGAEQEVTARVARPAPSLGVLARLGSSARHCARKLGRDLELGDERRAAGRELRVQEILRA